MIRLVQEKKMYKLALKGFLRKTIPLWIILFASPACMAQMEMAALLGRFQRDADVPKLPFTLPEQLFAGSYPRFPNARIMREVEYTDSGRILVYFYGAKNTAVNDTKIFAGKNTKITRGESSILNSHFGCWEENEQFTTAWFTVGSYVIGIKIPKSKTDRTSIIRTAEKIVKDYDARIEQLFSTPEKCLKTYLEAVKKTDKDLIVECLYDDGSEQTGNAITMVNYFLSLFPIMRMYEKPGPEKDIVIVRTEMVSDIEARIAMQKQSLDGGALPLALLTFGHTVNTYTADEYLWVPLKTNGEKWGINIAEVQKSAFAKSQEQARRTMCMSNLKQIGLAVRMYAQDYKETMPEDLRALYPRYVSNGRVFKCPEDTTIQEVQKIDGTTPISYAYVKGLSLKDKSLNQSTTILAYDASSQNHKGEGRCVLFVDGHVAWMTEEQFQKSLKEQKF